MQSDKEGMGEMAIGGRERGEMGAANVSPHRRTHTQ